MLAILFGLVFSYVDAMLLSAAYYAVNCAVSYVIVYFV